MKAMINSRTLRAFSSVIDLSPIGNYSELMPKGSREDRLAAYWQETANYLDKAIGRHDQKAKRA